MVPLLQGQRAAASGTGVRRADGGDKYPKQLLLSTWQLSVSALATHQPFSWNWLNQLIAVAGDSRYLGGRGFSKNAEKLRIGSGKYGN